MTSTAQGGDHNPTEMSNVSKLYDMLQSKSAPAVGGKAIFEKDFEIVKMSGIKTLSGLFGKKIRDNDKTAISTPINFGSKSETQFMPDDTRLRLFALKKLWNDVEIQACALARSAWPEKKHFEAAPRWKDFQAAAKAFNVTDFSDWIDTVQARFWFEEFEIPHILQDQFDSLPMDSSLVRVPGCLGLLEGELEADDATFTAQSLTQASYTVESKNNVVHVIMTQDILDDSSPPVLEKWRRAVMDGVRRAYERAILDGVKAGTTHIDDDKEALPKTYCKAFDGLRYRALNSDTVNHGGAGVVALDHNDTPNKDLFAKLLKAMGNFGVEKSNLRYIMGTSVEHDLVTGAIPELFTAFAFGGLASNVTGQVPPVFGVQGVTSELVREDLDIDGTDNSGGVPTATDRTYMLLVDRSRFMNHVRQATRVWAAPSLPSSDQLLMSAKWRGAFAGTPQTADERSVVIAYNVKTSP
jgi:hypothetical protein